jgi:hypothetical protein
MGQAFHRKRISIDRSRTSGIGFKYVEVTPPPVRKLTPEQVTTQEQEAQQQAVLSEQRRLQQEHTDNVVRLAGDILRAWKKWDDYNVQRLVDFPGWTTSNYCTLPVDEEVADYYHDQIERHKREADRPFSLDEIDKIVKACCQRRVSSGQIVEEATTAIRYAAQKCTTFEGNDLMTFIQMLSRRAARAKQTNTGLDEALAFVTAHISSVIATEEPAA